jgi:hypothetical protein
MQTAAVKQKGIQSILTERGLWRDKCCFDVFELSAVATPAAFYHFNADAEPRVL